MRRRAVVLAVVLVPFTLAVPIALFGDQGDHQVGLAGLGGLGGPIGVWLLARHRESAYWELDRSSREAVLRTQYSGVPSGERDLDQLAYERLCRYAPSWRTDRIVLPIACAATIGVFVVAAARSSPWWLLAAAVAAPLLTGLCLIQCSVDPRTLRDDLAAELGV